MSWRNVRSIGHKVLHCRRWIASLIFPEGVTERRHLSESLDRNVRLALALTSELASAEKKLAQATITAAEKQHRLTQAYDASLVQVEEIKKLDARIVQLRDAKKKKGKRR